LRRLPQQHKDQENIAKFISALVTLVQDLEDALFPLLTDRTIDTAVGEQLNIIGRIVKEDRLGQPDDTYYRIRIRARIAANKSHGLIEDLILVARLALRPGEPRIVIQPHYPAAVLVSINELAVVPGLAEVVYRYLRIAAAAGVALFLETVESSEEDAMTFLSETSTYLLVSSNTIVGTLLVENTTSFPASGSIVLNPHTAIEEIVTYSSKTLFTFVLSQSLSNVHSAGSGIELPGEIGLGFGDNNDATVGGILADVRGP
jgi:hypothetical protein